MMVTWALFSCQGDIWNLAKQNEHITYHRDKSSVFVLMVYGGASGSRTLAPVSRPIAFRVFKIVG